MTQFITFSDDHFVPWWVTRRAIILRKRHRTASPPRCSTRADAPRSALDFVTIDSASTEDMDDALYAESTADGKLLLTVAIADPTTGLPKAASWITPQKCAPYQLSAGLQHSNAAARAVGRPLLLRANEVRPVLACRMTLAADGTIEDNRVLCRHHRIEPLAC